MKVTVSSGSGELEFIGENSIGNTLTFSGAQKSVSPMEGVLMAAGSCSAIDVELILTKMKQEFSKVEVMIEAERADSVPKVFTKIHMHYKVYGNIKQEKAEKAVRMSMESYCSVSIMLSKAANISYSTEVIS
ncbi:MAG: OsmC family protein [Saprospiraceae bacterium]